MSDPSPLDALAFFKAHEETLSRYCAQRANSKKEATGEDMRKQFERDVAELRAALKRTSSLSYNQAELGLITLLCEILFHQPERASNPNHGQ